MPDIVAANGREALTRVAGQVLHFGDVTAPRGLVTKELEHLTVEIHNPYDALCLGINANQSVEVAAAEAIQLIGGFSDPGFAVKHAPALGAFLNNIGEFDGAYGPRLKNQYANLIGRLRRDPDTRQAVLTIWDEGDLARILSKDYPCTLVLGFAIRRDRLNLSVVMRSNDVNWGFKNDIFQFTQLQLTIANVLGLEAGVYRHTAFSMHLYERDFEWAESLNASTQFSQLPGLQPTGLHVRSADGMSALASHIAYPDAHMPASVSVVAENPSHAWYLQALHKEGR